MTPTFVAFAAALAAALVLTPLAMRAALAFGIMDAPDKRLKRHRAPVPYLGGTAIFLAAAGAVLGTKLAGAGSVYGVVGILGGATVVFLLGLYDDVHPLGPKLKLAVQVAAAAIPVATGVHIKFIANPWGAVPLTLFWIAGVTNAFNLLDIMDGLCGGIAAIAAGWFWIIAAQHGRFNDALTAASLCGASLGFLWYNRPPARVFMGDAGSLFLGFALASVAIGQGYSLNTQLGVIAPLYILAVPIFETLFVMMVRWQQGKPVLLGSPDHIPLRLVRIGYTRPQAVRLLWAWGLGLGLLAYLVSSTYANRALLLVVVSAAVAVLVAIRLASVRMD